MALVFVIACLVFVLGFGLGVFAADHAFMAVLRDIRAAGYVLRRRD